MTTDDLRDRALENLPGGPAKFGMLLLLILGAILTAVIEHYVEKVLDRCDRRAIRKPGLIARWQLRRAIRRQWTDPRVTAAMAGSHWTVEGLDSAHGDDVQAALLALAAGLSDDEISKAGAHTC